MSKVIRLTDARQRRGKQGAVVVNNRGDDRRRDVRSESRAPAFVQIVACNEPEMIGTTVSCNTLDVSSNGLKFESDASIPSGCKLDIWVDIDFGPGKFFLTSDVRWSRNRDDGLCELGVELRDGATTDYKEWWMVHAH